MNGLQRRNRTFITWSQTTHSTIELPREITKQKTRYPCEINGFKNSVYEFTLSQGRMSQLLYETCACGTGAKILATLLKEVIFIICDG